LIGVFGPIRDLAKLDRTVQTWRFFTWKCILWIVTSQSFLIKHCGISAEETPFGRLNHISIIVFDWKTDVENLTSTLNIRIVSISLTFTREGIRVGILEYVLTSGWEATSGSILRQDVSTSENEHEYRHVSHGDTHTAAVVAVRKVRRRIILTLMHFYFFLFQSDLLNFAIKHKV
jgi:hypothetical protein